MSRTRNYKQETLDVQRRFFEALHRLADEKRIPGGLCGYCTAYGLDRRHMYTQELDLNRGYFEVAWIIPLIKYYRVSSNWLLLGKGNMFRGLTGTTSASENEPQEDTEKVPSTLENMQKTCNQEN